MQSAGFDMDELYMFDIKSQTWEFIRPKGQKPAARYLHSAVVIGDCMVIFGGNDKASGDVWSFNLEIRRWKQLSQVPPLLLSLPCQTFMLSAVSVSFEWEQCIASAHTMPRQWCKNERNLMPDEKPATDIDDRLRQDCFACRDPYLKYSTALPR